MHTWNTKEIVNLLTSLEKTPEDSSPSLILKLKAELRDRKLKELGL